MSDTHLPTDNPVNPSVRYERSDASYKGVVAFGVYLAGICVVSAALLWWMFVAYIRHENAVKRSDFRSLVTPTSAQGLIDSLQKKVVELSGGALS